MTQPSVSIVIPCWNAEKDISAAIQSALSQSYQPVDVVVVDDGSTDNSLAVIRSFGSRIRWISVPNQGGAAARNHGIELADSEFIQFLDADDELDIGRIQAMVHASVTCGANEVAASDWWTVPVGCKEKKYVALDCQGLDPVLFCLQHSMGTSSPLHRRSLLQQVGGFRAELPCSQERDLHLRLSCAGVRWRRVPEALYTVHRRSGSVSDGLLRVLDQHADIFLLARDQLLASGQLTREREMGIARALCGDGRRYVRMGELKKARRYFQLARDVSSQGVIEAFGRWYSRTMCRLAGPFMTELFLQAGLRAIRRDDWSVRR